LKLVSFLVFRALNNYNKNSPLVPISALRKKNSEFFCTKKNVKHFSLEVRSSRENPRRIFLAKKISSEIFSGYSTRLNGEFLNCGAHYKRKICGFFYAKKISLKFSLEVRGFKPCAPQSKNYCVATAAASAAAVSGLHFFFSFTTTLKCFIKSASPHFIILQLI